MSSYRYSGRCLLMYNATGKRARAIHATGSRHTYYRSLPSRASKFKTTLGAVNRPGSAVFSAANPF